MRGEKQEKKSTMNITQWIKSTHDYRYQRKIEERRGKAQQQSKQSKGKHVRVELSRQS